MEVKSDWMLTSNLNVLQVTGLKRTMMLELKKGGL